MYMIQQIVKPEHALLSKSETLKQVELSEDRLRAL